MPLKGHCLHNVPIPGQILTLKSALRSQSEGFSWYSVDSLSPSLSLSLSLTSATEELKELDWQLCDLHKHIFQPFSYKFNFLERFLSFAIFLEPTFAGGLIRENNLHQAWENMIPYIFVWAADWTLLKCNSIWTCLIWTDLYLISVSRSFSIFSVACYFEMWKFSRKPYILYRILVPTLFWFWQHW